MRPALTLAAFAAGLAAVFATAAGVGSAVGSSPPVAAPHADDHAAQPGGHSTPGPAAPAGDDSRGLAVSAEGFTLALDATTIPAGRTVPFSFTIQGPTGKPVTAYTPEHEKDLHLIVVRRDATRFHHVHPVRDAAGRWSVPLRLDAPGPYKVFADFVPAGRTRGLTLAADVTVPGSYTPTPQGAEVRTASVDGYTVTLDGQLVPGRSSRLVATVSRNGRPVTDLQPYLGAYGHLVALRDGDLAYLHVHPDGEPQDGRTPAGPAVTFHVDVPSAGQYRLFLDFQHQSQVRTASFSARAGGTPAAPAPAATSHGGPSHGH